MRTMKMISPLMKISKRTTRSVAVQRCTVHCTVVRVQVRVECSSSAFSGGAETIENSSSSEAERHSG